jgi:hypothetical protein
MRHFFKLNFIRFFVHRNNGEKCSSESRKGFLFFASITLIELFVNCSELKNIACIGRAVSGSLKAIECNEAKLVLTYDLQQGYIATKDLNSMLTQI